MNNLEKYLTFFLIPVICFGLFVFSQKKVVYADTEKDCSEKNVICYSEFINDEEDDPDDGKCVIQNVINDADDGDTIYIKAGQYTFDESCPKFDIRRGDKINSLSVANLSINKSLTIIGEGWDEQEGTVIGPADSNIAEGILIEVGGSHTYTDNELKLQNLRIKASNEQSGVILTDSYGSLKLIHCLVEGKLDPSVDYYNGVSLQGYHKGRTYKDLIIKGSLIKGFNNAIYIPGGGRNDWHKTLDVKKILVANNIIYDNQVGFSNQSSTLGDYNHRFVNNTFLANGKVIWIDGGPGLSSTFGGVWENNIFENWQGPFMVTRWKDSTRAVPVEAKMRGEFKYYNVWKLDNNIDYIFLEDDYHYQIGNPKFVDYNNNDFHLSSNSPCKDAGDPNVFDPDGSRSDLGAYGGPEACLLDNTLPGCGGSPTPTLSGSPTSTPSPSPKPTPAVMVKELLESYGTMDADADLNSDGLVTGFDFGQLVKILNP